MTAYSTNQAAKKLGITGAALSRYVKAGKVPAPKIVHTGWKDVHSWTDEDIERLRKLLPKIANGRKTRYQKQKGKNQKPQPRAAHGAPGSSTVPHKNKQSALSNQQSGKTKSKTTKKK